LNNDSAAIPNAVHVTRWNWDANDEPVCTPLDITYFFYGMVAKAPPRDDIEGFAQSICSPPPVASSDRIIQSTPNKPLPWPTRWRGTADFTCNDREGQVCLEARGLDQEHPVTVEFAQYYDWSLKVHRTDHTPRCWPFDMLHHANDSRPCSVWFADQTYYDFAPDSYCCILDTVPLLNPQWPVQNVTYMGTTTFNGQNVNGFGPYPTELYYFQSLRTGHVAGWTSDVTVLEMKWYEDMTALSAEDSSWWNDYLKLPAYCANAKKCAMPAERSAQIIV